MTKKYSEKLKDPRWQKLRLQILERDEWICQRCFNGESTLHVHHMVYTRGRDPWEYSCDSLITLCEECHNVEHELMEYSITELINSIKEKGFLSSDINNIASGFRQLKFAHGVVRCSETIAFALGNKEIMELIYDKYIEWERLTYGNKIAQRFIDEGANNGTY